MYSIVLLIHSWLRWAVILAGLLAIVRASGGWSGARSWTRQDDRAGLWFILTLDVQLLLGLLLYLVLSPFAITTIEDFGAVMANAVRRFWAVEHTFGMALGVVLAHVGRVRARKAPEYRKHRTAAIFYLLALLAILIAIPWPGVPAGRPLFRW